jgi:uncharacterized protein (TIGR03435 family)
LDRQLFDETGLMGNYDFTLQWDTGAGPLETSLTPALEQQLGLRLEPRESPVEILVIDNVEKPSEN